MSIGKHSLKNLIGEARSAAISVHTNPRNREHNWYPFWGLFLLTLMEKIVHRSTFAAQFPLWRIADELEDDNEAQDPREAEADERVSHGSDDPIELEEAEPDERSPHFSDDDMDIDSDNEENDVSFSSGSGTSSESTRQRLTDFAIVMWDTYSSPDSEEEESSEEDDDCDNTMSDDRISSPRKLQEEDDDNESLEEDNDCDNTMSDDKMIPSSKSQEDSGDEESSEDEDDDTPPRNDKISPPRKSQIKDTIKEYVPVLVEIKKYPSRSFNKEEWCGRLLDGMAKARKDVVRQACFLFNCSRWKNQKAVLLIAAVGDYWGFVELKKTKVRRLARRLQNPASEDNAEWTPKPELIQDLIDELCWSGIAKYGSSRSNNHEEQVIGWVNGEYPNP